MLKDKIISPKAAKDISSINDWYLDISPETCKNFLLELNGRIKKIMKRPELYKPVNKKIRRSILTKFPYIIFYTTDKDFLIILRIRHEKQKPLKRYK